jgi:3'-phosphoadenosine 5'-phosphosulfate (PAPS) 3'-phosphatase
VDTLKSVASDAGTPFDTAEQVYAAIDCGAFDFEGAKASNGGITPSHYFILDPIDGTKVFAATMLTLCALRRATVSCCRDS